MKKRLHLKKIKQRLQKDMLDSVWDGSNQDKKRIMKMNVFQMVDWLYLNKLIQKNKAGETK